jgi:hypothetical protein
MLNRSIDDRCKDREKEFKEPDTTSMKIRIWQEEKAKQRGHSEENNEKLTDPSLLYPIQTSRQFSP